MSILLQDMESSNEPVSPFDPYEHVANLTLHDESPLNALAKQSEPSREQAQEQQQRSFRSWQAGGA